MVVELGLADANYKTVDWQTGSQGGGARKDVRILEKEKEVFGLTNM